jgi:asparagine synthetase B (glutamine-hydrolysing)
MPGIAGVIGSGADRSLLAPLLAAHRLNPTEVVSAVTALGAALGQVSLGIGGEDGGVARRGSRVLVAAGDVPGLGDFRRPLVERLLDRVGERGPEGLADLNGIVAACLWEEESATATLVNDRLGLGRLYYRLEGKRLKFASRARALAESPAVDPRALGQLLQVGYPLEDRTLSPGVRLLPPASIATWRAGELLIRRVWEPPPPAVADAEADPGQTADALGTAISHAVERVLDHRLPVALPLSGGLDSRTLLGLTRGRAIVNTVSYGHGHSWDLRFGAQLARRARSRHYEILLGRDYMARFGARGVHLTDGEAPLHAFHILCLNPVLAQQPSLILSGFLGDALTGAHLAWVRPEDLDQPPAVAARALYDRHYRVGFTDEELERLLRRPLLKEAQGAAYEAFLATYRRGEGAYGSADRVDLELRQRRFIAYQLAILGAAGLARAPFADHEVIDVALRLPLSQRRGQAAYIRFITQNFPDLARVPHTVTGIPLAGPRPLLALRRWGEWWRRRGLKRLTFGHYWPHDYRQYAHLDEWIRQGARDFYAELIEDRVLLGDLLDLEQIADLFKAHLEGKIDAHGRLSAVATLALWRRQMMAAQSAETPGMVVTAGSGE